MYKRFGASIYLGLDDYTLKNNLTYLDMLASEGAQLIFISAHMPERSILFADELTCILKKANENKMKVILDVNKKVYEAMNSFDDIYALRLDYGFSQTDMIEVIQNTPCLVELNASTITVQLLEALKNNGLNNKKVRFSFNFYPKEYTGMKYEDVVKITDLLHSYGFSVMMFIPSSTCKRPPLYEGLPTIEAHRHLMLTAILADVAFLDVDEVVFSDAICSRKEIQALKNFKTDIFELPLELFVELKSEIQQMLIDTHYLRKDQGGFLLRTTTRYQTDIAPYNNVAREPLFVTMDNSLFSRYAGEISICLKELEQDKRVNVIGKLHVSMFLLSKLTDSHRIRFIL